MKHKAIIFTLSCLILGLSSCKIDINNRPKGYYLNYWLYNRTRRKETARKLCIILYKFRTNKS